MPIRRLALLSLPVLLGGANAGLILRNGRIVTLDRGNSVAQAIAFKDGRIAAVGTDGAVLGAERGARTRVIDLGGKMVLPRLGDAHVHTLDAGLSELRGKLPPLDSITAIQAYIRGRAKTTPKGAWIVVPRTLPPRLKGSVPQPQCRLCQQDQRDGVGTRHYLVHLPDRAHHRQVLV